MKMTLPFAFPVMAMGRHPAWPGAKTYEAFGDQEAFSTCSGHDLKSHVHDGMLVIDSKGRCWEIVGVHKLGRAPQSFWSRIIGYLLFPPCYKVSFDLAEREPWTLQAVKDDLCAAAERREQNYWWDEHAPEEYWDKLEQWDKDQLAWHQAAVQASPDLPQLLRLVFWADLDVEEPSRPWPRVE